MASDGARHARRLAAIPGRNRLALTFERQRLDTLRSDLLVLYAIPSVFPSPVRSPFHVFAAGCAIPAELGGRNDFRNHRLVVVTSPKRSVSVKHVPGLVCIMISSPGEDYIGRLLASGTNRLILKQIGQQQKTGRDDKKRDHCNNRFSADDEWLHCFSRVPLRAL